MNSMGEPPKRTFSCECGLNFRNKNALRNHRHTVHVSVVDIHGPDEVVEVKRQDEIFRCLCGGQERNSKNFIQRHRLCFFPEQDSGNDEENVDNDQHDGPEQDPFDDSLKRFGLLFDEDNSLLLCIDCGYHTLTTNYKRHLRRMHKRRIDAEVASMLDSKLDEVILRDAVDFKNQPPVDPLTYLSTVKGFRCTLCFYYCKSSASIREHLAKTHKTLGQFEDCLIQKFPGPCQSYFGVMTFGPGPVIDSQVEARFEGETGDLPRTPGCESQDQRPWGDIYTIKNWYIEDPKDTREQQAWQTPDPMEIDDLKNEIPMEVDTLFGKIEEPCERKLGEIHATTDEKAWRVTLMNRLENIDHKVQILEIDNRHLRLENARLTEENKLIIRELRRMREYINE